MIERRIYRIYRLYGQLKVLETELEQARPGPAPDQLITALEDAAMRLAGALPIA